MKLLLNNDQLEEWNKYPSIGSTEGPKKDEFKVTARHIIIKIAKFKDKENYKISNKKKIMYKRTSIRLSNNLSGNIVARQRRQWHPIPVLLPGKSHGQRSLVGCSPWGREESDTTERLHFHFSLSCTGEGNGNPLQCSCLENLRDGEPGGLPSTGSHRVGYDWSDLAAVAAL